MSLVRVVATGIASATVAQAADPLRFDQDGTFKIVQFADLHFGEAEDKDWGPFQDVGSLHVINTVLDAEEPDLVVFTGDQITVQYPRQRHSILEMIVEPCVQRNTDRASIFGNHDTMAFEDEHAMSTTSREELMAFDTSFPNSHSRPASNLTHAVSTYYLDVLMPAGDDSVGARLWFFDTGGGAYPEHVYADQVDWYLAKSKILPKASVSLAFLHIPLPEYASVNPSSDGCFGMSDDGVATTDNNAGLLLHSKLVVFAQLSVTTTETIGCPLDQVHLVSNSGAGGYGSWDRGARAIYIKNFGKAVDTHVQWRINRLFIMKSCLKK